MAQLFVLPNLQLQRLQDSDTEEDADSAEDREAYEAGRRAYSRNKIKSLKARCEEYEADLSDALDNLDELKTASTDTENERAHLKALVDAHETTIEDYKVSASRIHEERRAHDGHVLVRLLRSMC